MATLHANAPADVPARLCALGALAGMDRRATDLHAAAAFDAVIHLEKTASGRRVTDVAVLRAHHGWHRETPLCVETALSVGVDGTVEEGPAWPDLRALLGWQDDSADDGRPPAGAGEWMGMAA